MNSSPVSPALGFLTFCVLGVLLSAAYDALRIWRAVFRSGKRAVFFQDFLYMILAAYLTFLADLGVCFGELRLYLFVGEALGWFAWHGTAGCVTVMFFRKIFRFLYRKIFDPAGARLHAAAEKLAGWMKHFAKSGQKWLQNREKGLKHCHAVVYNYCNRGGKRKKHLPGGKKAHKRMKVIEGRTKRKNKKSFLLRFAILVFSAYILVLLVQQQSVIYAKKQQLASVNQQIRIQEIRNDNLKSAAGSGNNTYMEKAAREGLDYSKPGERVYVIISGK